MRHHIKFIDLLVGADQFIVYMLQKHTRNTDTINKYFIKSQGLRYVQERAHALPAWRIHA